MGKKLWQVFPGVRHVHLMTEDAAVVKDQGQFPNVTFHVTEFERKNTAEFGLPPAEVDALALNSLLNLYIASDAVGFIGTASSSWFRAVVLLAFGKYCEPPVIATLDYVWDTE